MSAPRRRTGTERLVIGCRVVGVALLLGLAPGVAAGPARAADTTAVNVGPWESGSQWLSLRAGYAKVASENAPDGLVGYGIAYERFVLPRWSVGFAVHHDLLGRFGGASMIEVPMTVQVARHATWGSWFRPYVGLGGGAYYRKTYRTGADAGWLSGARFLTFGFNMPVSPGRLLGVDTRVSWLDLAVANPVFAGQDPDHVELPELFGHPGEIITNGFESRTETHWSVKVNYSFTY